MARNIVSIKTGWVGKNGCFILTRVELLFTLCYEIPCTYYQLFNLTLAKVKRFRIHKDLKYLIWAKMCKFKMFMSNQKYQYFTSKTVLTFALQYLRTYLLRKSKKEDPIFSIKLSLFLFYRNSHILHTIRSSF